jgi:neutral ceramidase
MTRLLTLLVLLATPALQAGFQAGVARARITPDLPVWLNGYAARTQTADHVMLDLWAKSLALDDGRGGRIVIVTADLLFLPRELTDEVADRCAKRFGLKRSQLLFNASHTHSGPAVWPKIRVLFDMNAEDTERSHRYALKLMDQLTQIVGDSLRGLSPAELSFGQGEADFAINRRIARLRELNPGKDFPAPTDHTVPVLRVTAPDGKLRAVLFAYACHNTTLTGEFYEVSGDYAGFAQAALEREHPGAQAMFMELCGGDQNPNPRSRIELPEKYGNQLAAAVDRAMSNTGVELDPPLRTDYETERLPLAPHSRAMFEQEAKSADPFKVRRAKLMLQDYDRGAPVQSVPYPVQAVRFGDGLTLLALGGEVVLDYSIRAKSEYPNAKLVVAGYSNDVMSYIPSLRVLREGGYEASDSMIYYELPGPYTERIEEEIFGAIHRAMAAVGFAAPIKSGGKS